MQRGEAGPSTKFYYNTSVTVKYASSGETIKPKTATIITQNKK